MAAWITHGRSRLVAAPAPAGTPPAAPTNVTSITRDAGATVSFLAPANVGSGPVTSYTVTPYIGGAAQTPATVTTGSAGTITGSNGSTYVQVPVTGLTNATAYTFTARASSAYGTGPESAASGANTPLAGLVFGDDFNGPAGGPIDPEWWVHDRCGSIFASEIEWYKPSQVKLDGSGNLLLVAQTPGHSGPSYPSDGNTVRNQPWLSGSVQNNTRTFVPAAGNTMTFEARQQISADTPGGMWPGLLWLSGQYSLTGWKTDPNQPGWDNATQAECDIAEWHPLSGNTNYQNNTYGNTSDFFNVNTATDFSLAMHVYSVQWKPGVSETYFRDGSQTHQNTTSGQVATSATNFFMLIQLQILAEVPAASSPQQCAVDYIHVYDQNLG